MKIDKVTFPHMMRDYRLEHCLTQRDCANAVGVAKTTWCDWENGKHFPPEEKAEQISQFLGFGEPIPARAVVAKEPEEKDDKLRACPYKGKCCMRWRGKCRALHSTKFSDGVCHFRKEYAHGPNMYDFRDKDFTKPVIPVYCKNCRHRDLTAYGGICLLTGRGVKESDYCSFGVEWRKVASE